jgi:hypothetical protein
MGKQRILRRSTASSVARRHPPSSVNVCRGRNVSHGPSSRMRPVVTAPWSIAICRVATRGLQS